MEVPGGSWSSPDWVPGGSRATLGQAPVKSPAGPGQVPGGSRSSLGQVPVKSRAGPGQVLGGSRAGLELVSIKSRVGPDQVPVRSRVNLGKIHQFENEMLKIRNRFTIFKTVNHFPKIKEEFSVKGKMISVDYYFTSK